MIRGGNVPGIIKAPVDEWLRLKRKQVKPVELEIEWIANSQVVRKK